MLICNCTLAGTNTCRYCSEYIKEFGGNNTNYTNYWNIGEWINYGKLEILPTYNPETHELVEKKDWKIKDLKLRLEVAKENFRKNGKEITRLQYLENDYAKAITDLEKEIKELES